MSIGGPTPELLQRWRRRQFAVATAFVVMMIGAIAGLLAMMPSAVGTSTEVVSTTRTVGPRVQLGALCVGLALGSGGAALMRIVRTVQISRHTRDVQWHHTQLDAAIIGKWKVRVVVRPADATAPAIRVRPGTHTRPPRN